MAALMRRLRPEMNGAVVESMTLRGIVYPLSYGVAVPAIREAAACYAPDHELARLLYQQEVRELRLAGIYTADAERVAEDELDFWARGVINPEVAEHLAYGLLSRSRVTETVLVQWLGSGQSPSAQKETGTESGEKGMINRPRPEWLRYAALMTGARALVKGNADWNYDRLMPLLVEACGRAVPAETQAWTTFLGRMIRHAPQGRERVRLFLDNPRIRTATIFPGLEEEVAWQLDESL